ncbi:MULTISPECIES: hypothetical protein [unclassified Rhodanobacter]|uniref:hypothetical protein n=1 Tax=unclassified Rhodanobacter TaxID=2621553 RepID=UPI0007AA19B8|nr:hypothetical protein [Rhodanobacter sp. FW510-R10]KZC32621.1 hypothetical protein RhoFW510R10_11950 [Rhodanobacter sp. FW510-R10]
MSTNTRYLTVVIQLPDNPAASSAFVKGFTDRDGVVGLYAGDALTEIELLEPHVSPARLQQIREEASRTPAAEDVELPHADDIAVEDFARAMKAKLAAARSNGRGGWANTEPGMQQRLSDMLREHVAKGDPRDVANFCLFLHQRGESILPAAVTEGVTGSVCEPAQDLQAEGYFAADPADGEFTRRNTLEEAVADAERMLAYAQDAASEDGWADESPQICYGIVLGGCVEREGSRRPAPAESEFTELVDYRLATPAFKKNTKCDPSYLCESALAALIEAVDPAIDSGDIIADAHTAAASVRARHGVTNEASPAPR